MIHHNKTPHRWITPPWDLISPDILHSITRAPSDDSIGSWAKQDHDVPQNKISTPSSTSLLHPSIMPPLYLSIGCISQKDFWKGKDNLPVQNSQVPWLLYTKLTSKETGCPVSTKSYPQIDDFQGKWAKTRPGTNTNQTECISSKSPDHLHISMREGNVLLRN